MTIGPAPMIRMDLMSVRLGTLLLLHRFHEALKEVVDVLRARARLRMTLEAERRTVGQLETLEAAVEQRDVSHLRVLWQRRRIDRKTVILARDHHAAGVQILHRMVRPVMAEFHLDGLRADRESEELVAEADAEERNADPEECADRADRVIAWRGIAGAVREQDAVRLEA